MKRQKFSIILFAGLLIGLEAPAQNSWTNWSFPSNQKFKAINLSPKKGVPGNQMSIPLPPEKKDPKSGRDIEKEAREYGIAKIVNFNSQQTQPGRCSVKKGAILKLDEISQIESRGALTDDWKIEQRATLILLANIPPMICEE